MLRLFPAGARTAAALFTMMFSGIGFAQRPVRPAPLLTKTPPMTTLQKHYQTPADQVFIPYMKSHLKKSMTSALSVNSVRPKAISDVVTPNFAGYVNAPNFAARNTASLAQGILDTGVTAEVEGDFNKDGKPDIKNHNDVVVVTYSSINTNSFEPYGECIMGSRGTMVVEQEQNVYLYGEKDPNVKEAGGPKSMAVTVAKVDPGKAVLDSSSTTGGPSGPPTAVAGAAAGGAAAGPVSRGYREEMEHFAYCIRMFNQAGTDQERKKWQLTPRCHGRVAMADAIIALTSNQAMRQQKRIDFQDSWFRDDSTEVPDPDMRVEEVS